jgi:hypothetical protein
MRVAANIIAACFPHIVNGIVVAISKGRALRRGRPITPTAISTKAAGGEVGITRSCACACTTDPRRSNPKTRGVRDEAGGWAEIGVRSAGSGPGAAEIRRAVYPHRAITGDLSTAGPAIQAAVSDSGNIVDAAFRWNMQVGTSEVGGCWKPEFTIPNAVRVVVAYDGDVILAAQVTVLSDHPLGNVVSLTDVRARPNAAKRGCNR